MPSERIRQAYDRLLAKVRNYSTWIIIATAALGLVVLIVVDGAVGYPIFERSRYLYKYLSAADNTEPQFSEGTLDGEIQATLHRVLPASWTGRVLYQRVERWAPIPLDDASTRDEALRKVADVATFPSFSYLGEGNSVLAGYRTLLSELRRDALIRAGSTEPATTGRASSANVSLPRSSASASSETSSMFERRERQLFALGQGSFSVDEIDSARLRIEQFEFPNPDTQFSPHPPVTFGQCDIDKWIHAARTNSARHRLSSVEMRVLPADIPAATPSMTSGASTESVNNPAILSPGTVRTTVLASDWKVCVITRPWLEEPILERVRGNIDPFIDTRELFGTGGALAAIPYAIVVAKDVTIEIVFSDPGAFEGVKNAVVREQTVRIQTDTSPLIVDRAVAAFDQPRHSIVIPATSGTAQVMFVVSKLY